MSVVEAVSLSLDSGQNTRRVAYSTLGDQELPRHLRPDWTPHSDPRVLPAAATPTLSQGSPV